MSNKLMHSLEEGSVSLRQTMGIWKSNYKVEMILWGDEEVLIRQTEQL